jgi:uncharacterized protein
VELAFGMRPRITRWYNDSIALEAGPILFALSPGEDWVKLRDRGPTADWQVYPTRQWNYALDVNEGNIGSVTVEERPIAERPFSSTAPPLTLKIKGRLCPAWEEQDGVAGEIPLGPIDSHEPERELALVPYACAKLRVSAFPQLRNQ